MNELEILLCSFCFNDEGIKLEAEQLGQFQEALCPNCKIDGGSKLNHHLILELCQSFFVRGTTKKCEYGAAPIIQFNEYQENQIRFTDSDKLHEDVLLLEKFGKINFFYYGPRMWMIGEVKPLKVLQNKETRAKGLEQVYQKYPVKYIDNDNHFYRVRKNPENPDKSTEYDSAPDEYLGTSRFDKPTLPILYGSSDLELCIHECRVSIEDDLYVSKLRPTKKLKLIDLTQLIDDGQNEFESLDIAIHFIFLAGKQSYEICRDLAEFGKKIGYDGIIFPSHFSNTKNGNFPNETKYGISIRKYPTLREYAQSQSLPNIALFGRPILNGKIKVECINRVIINQAAYNLSFGPII